MARARRRPKPEQEEPAQDTGSPFDLARLEAMGASLAQKRQKAVDARFNAGMDERWAGDIEAYEGRDEVTRQYAGLRAAVQGYIEAGTNESERPRSMIVANVTRQKVNTAAARLADIALPSDDRNFDIVPSKSPEMVQQLAAKHQGLTRNGQPIMVTEAGKQRQATVADLANMNVAKAKKAAQAMRDEIDDQLNLSNHGLGIQGVLRQIIFDCRVLGVGIIKGPVKTLRSKKVWVPVSDGVRTLHKLSRISDSRPQSYRVDPWDFYPHEDCGENVKKGAGVWEYSRVTAAEIRQMADIEGYIVPNLVKVLREGPRQKKSETQKPADKPVVDQDTIFGRWYYYGELSREDLTAAGHSFDESNDADLFRTYFGVVEMINDTVVKADISLLDTEELPYDVLVINPVAGSWAGYSESYLCRMGQKVITAGWRAMLDNAGQIVGAQVVMNRQAIEPVDGKWEITGIKAWFDKREDGDVGKVFAVHEIPAHQAEFAAIIKMGMEFLDQESAIPMLAEGQQGNATDTLGGMNILLTSHNVILKRGLKALDDQIIIPHIGRYVDWNMQYNPKDEIKGDFEVHARASGALLDRDIQNRGVGNLLNLAKDPEFAYGMKKWSIVRRALASWRFDPAEFVRDDNEIDPIERKRAENPPQDPRVAIEEMRIEVAKLRMQFEAGENDKDRRVKVLVEMIDERMQSKEIDSTERAVLAKIKAELATTAIETRAQIALSRENRVKNRLPKPRVEPPGRAKNGQAFTQ